MKIKKNVSIPKISRRGKLGEVALTLLDFVDSDDTNIKFECGGKEEANRVYSTSCGAVKRYKLPLKVMRSMNDIYVVRKEG